MGRKPQTLTKTYRIIYTTSVPMKSRKHLFLSTKSLVFCVDVMCLTALVCGCATNGGMNSVRFGARVPVILYHRIVPDSFKSGPISGQDDPQLYLRSESQFKKEMAYLADHGYTPISLYQLRDYLLAKDSKLLPSRPVVITFDDGSADWFEIVYPILVRHGFTATFFLITDDASRRKYLGESIAANWKQIEQMANYKSDGGRHLFHFESHSHTHRDLSETLAQGTGDAAQKTATSKDGAAIVRHELTESMKIIEQRTGRKPRFLALPFGGGGWASPRDERTFPILKAIAGEVGYYGIRTSRRDIPNDLTTDPYKLGAQITMLSITSYERFLEQLKRLESR